MMDLGSEVGKCGGQCHREFVCDSKVGEDDDRTHDEGRDGSHCEGPRCVKCAML